MLRIFDLEMLAVCWATLKCKLFMTGLQHFSVITDHQSLIPPIAAQNQVDGIELY